jgi:uncharacterized membrane protein
VHDGFHAGSYHHSMGNYTAGIIVICGQVRMLVLHSRSVFKALLSVHLAAQLSSP